MLRRSVRTLAVAIAHVLAMGGLAEAQQREIHAGFIIRNGKDTIFAERFTRRGDTLQGIVTRRNGGRLAYIAELSADQAVRDVHFTDALFRREPVSASADFQPRGFKLQLAGSEGVWQDVNTRYFPIAVDRPFGALFEQVIRATMRDNKRGSTTRTLVLSALDTSSMSLSRIDPDSIKVVVGKGFEARVAVSPSGDVLGGTAINPAGERLTIDRVTEAPEFLAEPASVPADTSFPTFTRFFDEMLRRDSIVGASIAFIRDGQIVDRHYYGYADRARGRRVDDATIFHYGSITKTLTAIAIMQLRDRGRLSLDDRVTNYVPELRSVHNEFGSMDSITIRMLLTHSAGFQNPTWPYTGGRPWEPFEPTTWNQLVAMFPYQEIKFKPGSSYRYSNPAFIYLARIVEQLSGDPYETYIQKNVFSPLGLTRSYYSYSPYHLAGDFSHNYNVMRDSGRVFVRENPTEFNPGITIPNGGWNAPLTDVTKYLAFLANATRGDTNVARLYSIVLNRSTLIEMWQPRYPTSGGADQPWRRTISSLEPNWVGLTFDVQRVDGMTLVGHGGDQAGFSSSMFLNPANGTGYIFAVNTRGPSVGTRQSAFAAIENAALGRLK